MLSFSKELEKLIVEPQPQSSLTVETDKREHNSGVASEAHTDTNTQREGSFDHFLNHRIFLRELSRCRSVQAKGSIHE